MWKRPALLALLGSLAAPALGAQASPVLRLADALGRADRRAFANRATRGAADAQRAAGMAALGGILPSARVEAGYVRTTDPIGAFGTALRQRTISQQDFDPSRLNYPAAAPNYLGGMVLEQPLFNADAWAGRRAAQLAADATDAQAAWTQVGTRVDVIKAWFGATLAREKVEMLTVALRAAREHVRQAEAMARNGMVTPSDAMLASVKAGEVEAMLVEAEGEARTARLGLATVMGTPRDTAFAVPSTLPASAGIRALATDVAAGAGQGARADVRAASAGASAAEADARRARALYLPRLNGFARYDWNSAARPFGGDNNWTVGLMASWTPFAGASEISEARATAGRKAAADAMREGAEARAALEDAQTASALAVALARLDIAERAVVQGTDAHRIVARKYEGGLAPVVELLDASAMETQVRLAQAAARYQLVVATAERMRATGGDPGVVTRLDDGAAVAAHPDLPND